MGRVYSQAATVVIWLGLAYKETDMALEFLHRLETEPSMKDEDITPSMYALTNGPRLDYALARTLSGRGYWDRLWILQEVVLGTKDALVCVGHDRISWDTLGVCIVRLRRYLRSLPTKPGAKGFQNNTDLRWAVEYGTAANLHDIKLMRKLNPQSDCESSNPPGNPVRYILGLAQIAECDKLHDKIYGLLGMVDFNMTVDYERDIFDLYSEALHHFRTATLSRPQDPHEIYTARLSQLLQRLLKGPFPLENHNRKVSCVRMSGVLSGEIVQIDGPGTRASTQNRDAAEQIDNVYKCFEERLEDILLSFEKSTGLKVTTPDERLADELTISPMRHLVLPCTPNYFYATGKATGDFERHLPESVPRTGSIPIISTSYLHPPLNPQLFLVSRQQTNQPLKQANADTLQPLIGLATLDAQIGDHIIRFLETDVCLVVRDSGVGEYRFVGCAQIPTWGDASTDRQVQELAWHVDHCYLLGSAPSYVQFQRDFQDVIGDRVDIVIDVETLQFVTSFGRVDIGV
jgi:hypothetical protein